MKIIKQAARKILRTIDPDLEYRMVDQFHFDQLKRKPPELMWQALSPAPHAMQDCGRAQLGQELFIFGGFLWHGNVSSNLDIFDLKKEKWTASIGFPEGMANTHLGIVEDGQRYIYVVSGQLGGNCRPATPACFVFDAGHRTWSHFPALPKARYAPVVQLWQGRLHVLAGSQEDRNTPATDHWSIAVKDGKALEEHWRQEPAVTRGGPHRASAIIDDQLYTFGGQEGDYVAIPGDANFSCTSTLTTETRLPDVYRLKAGAKTWERMADMPVAVSHTESSVIRIDDLILLFGGDDERKGKASIITVVDVIQLYDPKKDAWKIIGRLPYRVKSCVVGYYNGYVYITMGQRDRGTADRITLNRFERGMWKARFDIKEILLNHKNSLF